MDVVRAGGVKPTDPANDGRYLFTGQLPWAYWPFLRARWAAAFILLPQEAMLHQRRRCDLVKSWKNNVQSCASHSRTSCRSSFESNCTSACATGSSRLAAFMLCRCVTI